MSNIVIIKPHHGKFISYNWTGCPNTDGHITIVFNLNDFEDFKVFKFADYSGNFVSYNELPEDQKNEIKNITDQEKEKVIDAILQNIVSTLDWYNLPSLTGMKLDKEEADKEVIEKINWFNIMVLHNSSRTYKHLSLLENIAKMYCYDIRCLYHELDRAGVYLDDKIKSIAFDLEGCIDMKVLHYKGVY